MEGRKDDVGKRRYDLLPFRSLGHVVDVLMFGARKYSPNNWQLVTNPRERYYAAALRHLVAYGEGERLDVESELPHIAHAACCLLFVLYFESE